MDHILIFLRVGVFVLNQNVVHKWQFTATTKNVMIACKPITGAVVGVKGGPDAGTETRSDVACLVYDMCSHGSGTGAQIVGSRAEVW